METPADSIRSILQDLFDRLRRECSARGAHGLHGLLSAFSLVESGGRGKVKLEDFKSILPQCGISISRAEMDALFAHFGVGGGSVDYIGFVGEVMILTPRALDPRPQNIDPKPQTSNLLFT